MVRLPTEQSKFLTLISNVCFALPETKSFVDFSSSINYGFEGIVLLNLHSAVLIYQLFEILMKLVDI